MSTTIQIVIDESQDSKSFKLGKRFFEEELEQAKKLILALTEKSKKVMENNNQEEYFHQHNTIAILGPRGVGKTSFLLSLKNFISKPGDKDKIIWLPIVDPTMMEKNEIFLVIVVANILKKIKKYYSGDLSQKIRDKLDSLSRDFAVLAPSQIQEEQWKDLLGDPNSFAYELLNHAHSGLGLAQSFHEFLHVCLKEIGAEAFVQPIDDVDSAIEQGWPILETLRRYLGTPHLITILSGDIRLYQSLVRKQQVDKLKSLIEVRKSIEGEPKIMLQTSELVDQVSQITDQYLAKLVPAYWRIHLTPLSIKIVDAAKQRDEDLVKIQYDSLSNPNKKDINFSEVYANFSYDLFNIPIPENCIEALKRKSWLPPALLPSATRSMVAFLKVIQPWSVDLGDEERKEKAVEALAQVFNNSLYNGGIQTDDLLALKAGKHLEWLAEYCLDTQLKFPEFWTLESLFDEEELDHRVLLFQAFLFHAWKLRRRDKVLLYPNGPLSFFVKVCFPCWIASTYHLNKNALQRMKLLLDLGGTIRHTYLVLNGLAYMMAEDKKRNLSYHDASIVEISAKIDEELILRRLFMFQPSIGHPSQISIFIGLARLADILREQPKTEVQLRNLLALLTESGMARISDIKNQQTGPEHQRDPQIRSYRIEDSKDLSLINYLRAWIKEMQRLNTKKLVSPLVISRTFRKFTRNLELIYRSDSPNSLGNTLELQIVAFLNSLLIEEVILNKGILDANLKLDLLTTGNQDFFKENLENYVEQGIIHYTLAMLCCPILLIFLQNTFNGCDLRVMSASAGNPKNEIIRKFKTEFESRKRKCSVLIVDAPSDSGKWTVAGFDDKGKFFTVVVIDKPNHELSKELKKKPRNERRIVELAKPDLGRTLFGNFSSPLFIKKIKKLDIYKNIANEMGGLETYDDFLEKYSKIYTNFYSEKPVISK